MTEIIPGVFSPGDRVSAADGSRHIVKAVKKKFVELAPVSSPDDPVTRYAPATLSLIMRLVASKEAPK